MYFLPPEKEKRQKVLCRPVERRGKEMVSARKEKKGEDSPYQSFHCRREGKRKNREGGKDFLLLRP